MDKEPKSPERDDSGNSIERYIQMIAGIAFMFYRWYEDGQKTLVFDSMSLAEIIWLAFPYLFAAILIKGMTFKQAIEMVKAIGDVVRAWKGKS